MDAALLHFFEQVSHVFCELVLPHGLTLALVEMATLVAGLRKIHNELEKLRKRPIYTVLGHFEKACVCLAHGTNVHTNAAAKELLQWTLLTSEEAFSSDPLPDDQFGILVVAASARILLYDVSDSTKACIRLQLTKFAENQKVQKYYSQLCFRGGDSDLAFLVMDWCKTFEHLTILDSGFLKDHLSFEVSRVYVEVQDPKGMTFDHSSSGLRQKKRICLARPTIKNSRRSTVGRVAEFTCQLVATPVSFVATGLAIGIPMIVVSPLGLACLAFDEWISGRRNYKRVFQFYASECIAIPVTCARDTFYAMRDNEIGDEVSFCEATLHEK